MLFVTLLKTSPSNIPVIQLKFKSRNAYYADISLKRWSTTELNLSLEMLTGQEIG